MTTIKEAVAEGARILSEARPQNNRRTARVLLARALGFEQERLLARPEEEITAFQYTSYLESISRFARGEPLQHITGHQEFYGLDFVVSPDVLIPRPETELLVKQALRLARSLETRSDGEALSPGGRDIDHRRPATPGNEPNPVIVDLGTGSGCIAIALAVHLPMARIIATDISRPALEVAKRNAQTHAVAGRIEFLVGDLFGPLEQWGLQGIVDLIVCNPPYVPSDRPELVQQDVRDFEPATALFGGPDGLSFYRTLLVEAPGYLKPGGYMVCEIGYSQLESVTAIVDVRFWESVDVAQDLQGIPRTLTLKRERNGYRAE